MGLFDKLFGSSEKETKTQANKPQVKKPIPLPKREKVQNVTTVSQLSYSIIRKDECIGTQINHYVFRDEKGGVINDFSKILWLFDLMVKERMSKVEDYKL